MVKMLLTFAHAVVVTEVDSNRALDCNKLAGIIRKDMLDECVYVEKNNAKAFNLAKNIAADDDLICCCGSLYLIGDIRSLMRSDG